MLVFELKEESLLHHNICKGLVRVQTNSIASWQTSDMY